MIRLKDNPPMAGPAALTVIDFTGRWTVAYCKPRQGEGAGLGFVPPGRELFSAAGAPLAVDFKDISVLTGAAADIRHKIKTAKRQKRRSSPITLSTS